MVLPSAVVSVKLEHVLDQHDSDVQQIGTTHNLSDPAGMCGFLSLAIVQLDNPICSSEGVQQLRRHEMLQCLEQSVLPAFFEMRQEYVKKHPREFCQEGTSWQESGGRMSQSSFMRMMAGTAEIQEYLRKHNDIFSSPVYLLRPILEGPAVDESSIRFPPSETAIELDRLFVQEERKFYTEPAEDFYVGDSSNQCYSLGEWGCRMKKYLESNPEKWVWTILDLHGHFCAVRVYSYDYDNVGCTVLDTMANNEITNNPAVLALSRALSVERSESQQTHTSKD